MRPLTIVVLTCLLCLAHCRGSGHFAIENISEGEGENMQVADDNTSAALVMAVILKTEQLFNEGLEREITAQENAAATNEVCVDGKTVMTVDPVTLEGASGAAVVSGGSEAEKTGDDAGISELKLSNALSAYTFDSALLGATLIITGTTTYLSNTDIDTGLQTICDATVKADMIYSGNSSVTIEGGLTIAGDYGAAISFEKTTSETYYSAYHGKRTVVAGSAIIKSDGKTTHCLILMDPIATTFGDYYIECSR